MNLSSKEELKEKICQYDGILTSQITLLPDTENATTLCGALKVVKQESIDGEENDDLDDKLAVVLGKDCKLESLLSTGKRDKLYVLLKTAIPSGTKHIIIEQSNSDLLSIDAMSADELSSIIRQCPKKDQSAPKDGQDKDGQDKDDQGKDGKDKDGKYKDGQDKNQTQAELGKQDKA